MDGSTEPTQLGRYQLLKRLTSGAMAELILARSTGMQAFERYVVIKRIHPTLSRDQRFVKMFLDEARLAASLHHQNIVQVQDVGEDQGNYFFAMEYVHGEDLRKLHAKARDRKEQIPLEVIISIIMAAAAGLHHAHEQRGPNLEPLDLVHRDVSLANILVGYDGSVKLLDFGLAKAQMRSVQTRTGTLKGKAEYMSPEQCMGRPLDRRSDVFSLGVVLYELVTTRRLFRAANDFLSMSAIVSTDVPPPSEHRRNLPPGFDEIVMRALAKTRESRYPSAEAMRGALEEFAIDAGLRTSTKLLADYMHLAFGEKPEPWRADLPQPEPELEDSGVAEPPIKPVQFMKNPRGESPIALARAIAAGDEPADEDDPDEFVDENATTVDPPSEFSFDPPSKATTGVRRLDTPAVDVHEATTAVGVVPIVDSSPSLSPISADTPPIDDDDSDTTTGKAKNRREAESVTDEVDIDGVPTAVSPARAQVAAIAGARPRPAPPAPTRATAKPMPAQPPMPAAKPPMATQKLMPTPMAGPSAGPLLTLEPLPAPHTVAPTLPSPATRTPTPFPAPLPPDASYKIAPWWKTLFEEHRVVVLIALAVTAFLIVLGVLLFAGSSQPSLGQPEATPPADAAQPPADAADKPDAPPPAKPHKR